MPSLFRFLTFLAVIGGLAYGAMYALVLIVDPAPRELSVQVPTDRINPVRVPQEEPEDREPADIAQ